MTTITQAVKERINKKALQIAERNLRNEVWTLRTAQTWLKGVDEQPERFLRLAKQRS